MFIPALPYRVKNPPDRFPYVTLGILILNTLIFAFTSRDFLVVRAEAVDLLAISHQTLLAQPWRMLTAMFLHGNIIHLLGNMLFLWLFGASTEGRLGPLRFIALYLLSGVAGDLAHDLVMGHIDPTIPSLGASGAIYGLAGAYLYMFPYSTFCVFYWFGWFFRGVWLWQARYVLLYYVGQEVLLALFSSHRDGIGHLAHLGGFGMGLLVTYLYQPRRDSEDTSNAQAVRAEVKDYTLLSRSELEALLQHPTEDMDLVMAYCEKAGLLHEAGGRPEQCLAALHYYSRPLAEKADAQRLAYLVLHIPPSVGGLAPVFYLRLASRLEAITSNDLAAQLYRRVYDLAPYAPETEVALFRWARLLDNVFQNRAQAQSVYAEMLRLFPNGQMALQARRALQQIGSQQRQR